MTVSAVPDTCAPCAYAKEHGWWGDTLPHGNATHCDDCHVSFPGAQVWGHCKRCHNTFRGVGTFDSHQERKECPPAHPLDEDWYVSGRPIQALEHVWGFSFYGTEGDRVSRKDRS